MDSSDYTDIFLQSPHDDDPTGFASATTNRKGSTKNGAFKLSREEFIRSTSSLERSVLRKELCNAIAYFLATGNAVHLAGLGILSPRSNTKHSSRVLNKKIILRKETIRTPEFEKCSELVSIHREKHSRLVETVGLTKRIYPRLPLHMQIKWNERELRAYIRGCIRSIADEVIVEGSSKQLMPIGELFAFHNRQGEGIDDWFAGSNIFITPHLNETVAVGKHVVFDRPVLSDAFEPLNALFGDPYVSFKINLLDELEALGYNREDFIHNNPDIISSVDIAVFKSNASKNCNLPTLIYATNGLRRLAFNAHQPNPVGSEVVFQLLDNDAISNNKKLSKDLIPMWPARPITMAWVLMQSSKAKIIKPGLGLSADLKLHDKEACDLSAIFSFPFKQIQGEQLSPEGPFRYINITGITKDEAQLAEIYSPRYLEAVLKFKKLDQVTIPARSSVARL